MVEEIKGIGLEEIQLIKRRMKSIAKKGEPHAGIIVNRANGIAYSALANTPHAEGAEPEGFVHIENPFNAVDRMAEVLERVVCWGSKPEQYGRLTLTTLMTEIQTYRQRLRKTK
ncbi:MAG: hypothetical protein Q8P92_01160 [Candidatus Daviesbacteria bacterium]|nr:hypothetical protein [Candidatus Daviesbacteria bacterium]